MEKTTKVLFTGVDYNKCCLYLVLEDGSKIELNYKQTLEVHRSIKVKVLRNLYKLMFK